MVTQTTPPPWDPRRGRPRADPARPVPGRNDVALAVIKAVHTLAWFSIESCMAYVLYAGVARRTDRRAALAGAVVGGESLIFAANGFRCPLTQLAENFGTADGSVTDIWLPRWFARNLPAIHVPLIAAAAYLNGRNLRERQRRWRLAPTTERDVEGGRLPPYCLRCRAEGPVRGDVGPWRVLPWRGGLTVTRGPGADAE